jgi:uncharacterized repeat protein (TIGR01451 family)
LPPTLTLVSATSTSGTAVANTGTNTVDWDGSIPAAGSITVTINATVKANTPSPSTISNQGTLHYDADGNGTNEFTDTTDDPAVVGKNDPTVFSVASPAMIAATKTVTGSFQRGGAVTYTVVLTNNGAAGQLDNPGNEFTDVLPPALTLVSATATAGTAVATVGTNTVAWNGAIAAGASVTITIQASIGASAALGPVSNQGTVNFDADGNGTNESTVLTDDPTHAGAADPTVFNLASPAILSADKLVSGVFEPSAPVTYTVILRNSGTGMQLDNPGNEFVDVLPAQLTLVSATATAGTAVANVGTNTVTWNGSIAAGALVSVTINATIKANAAPGPVSNQGTVNYDADGDGTNEATAMTDDPGPGGSADATVFTLASPASVTATKTVSGTYVAGGSVTYTVVLNNTSTNTQLDNPGNELIDVLPASLHLVSASASSGTAVATLATSTVTWNGTVVHESSVTITINASIDAGFSSGTVSNQGTVNFDADGNGTNESTAQTDDPGQPGNADATVFSMAVLAPTEPVPALDGRILMLLGLALAAMAWQQRRKSR